MKIYIKTVFYLDESSSVLCCYYGEVKFIVLKILLFNTTVFVAQSARHLSYLKLSILHSELRSETVLTV